VEDAPAAADSVRRRRRPPSEGAARQAQPPRRLRREVGRAQDQVSYDLCFVEPSFHFRRQQHQDHRRRTPILPQERDLAAAQAWPGGFRGEVGRAQEGSEPSFVVVVVVVFRHVFPCNKQQQVDDQPRVIVCRALGRAQEASPAAGRAARRRREQQYRQQRRHRHGGGGGGDSMEAAGHVRRTGLRRRRAGAQHASHADIVLGSRCIIARCTTARSSARTHRSVQDSGGLSHSAAGFFSSSTNDAYDVRI